MMKKLLSGAVALGMGLIGLAAYGEGTTLSRDELIAEIGTTPEKSGGIYYAYPVREDSLAPVPRGFEPYYITHYGRHGSRWVINLKIYPEVLEELRRQNEKGNLTPQGKRLMGLVESCEHHARGHSGELTPLGERQHASIARRMAQRFPTLFGDSSLIVMRSSTEPRCIISMAAFSESLKDYNPELRVERHATPGDMEFIHHKSQELREISSPEAPWMRRFSAVRDSLTRCETSAAGIFTDPSKVSRLPRFMRYLHDIAIDVQDVDGLPEECGEIITVFTAEDLYNLWAASNYMMFVRHSDATPGRDVGPRCAANLLEKFMRAADERTAGQTASLHFGHDTSIIPLLSLMGVERCSPSGAEGPEEVAGIWQTYRVSPMGANLQMIHLRDNDGRELVGLRLNEYPVRINGLEEYAPGYYKREELYIHWKNKK